LKNELKRRDPKLKRRKLPEKREEMELRDLVSE